MTHPQPQELRIGNFVCDVEADRIYTVTGLTIDTIEAGPLTIYRHGLDHDHGIPLTEEWLIRFGFENMDDKDIKVYCKSFGEFDGEDFSDAICISLDAEGNWYFSLGRKVVCQYVHHAQNIFHAITGQDLTIKENVV